MPIECSPWRYSTICLRYSVWGTLLTLRWSSSKGSAIIVQLIRLSNILFWTISTFKWLNNISLTFLLPETALEMFFEWSSIEEKLHQMMTEYVAGLVNHFEQFVWSRRQNEVEPKRNNFLSKAYLARVFDFVRKISYHSFVLIEELNKICGWILVE